MEQRRLSLWLVDLKYIRSLARADDHVMSVSPQIGKSTRPFLGVIVLCGEKQYCVPLSSPKPKHNSMKNDVDFDFRFLRPLKAERIRKWYDALQFRPNIEYGVYDQAIVFPYKNFRDWYFVKGGGANVAAGTQLSCPALKDLVVGNYSLENIKYRDETAVYCGYLFPHWGHFIAEHVNQLCFFGT